MELTSFSYFLLCGLYSLFCVVYLMLGVNCRKQWQKALLKCLPITLLLGIVTFVDWSEQLSRDREKSGDLSRKRLQLLLFGLIFSGLGDGLLVFYNSLGILGILSFAVAQCIYISLFGLSIEALAKQTAFGLLSGMLVLILSLSILLLFGWRFNGLLKSGDPGMRRRFIGLVMPMALVYFSLISLMLWSAILQLQNKMNLVGFLGAIGGFLFYVSDVLIAAGAIWRLRILLHGRIFVMVTYYSAQLLITLSVVM